MSCMASCALTLLLGVSAAAWSFPADNDVNVSLLQMRLEMPEKMDASMALPHYWPHIRGHPGHYGITKYPMVISSNNLSDSLLWSKFFGEGDMLWGSVIDHERNIYTSGLRGMVKLTPEGKEIWRHPGEAFYSVLVGNAVCSQSGATSREVYCLSQKTGKEFWARTVFPAVGLGGNQMEANKGVLMVAAGRLETRGLSDLTGVPNDRIIGVNASTGDELWQFKVSCGMWMFMGLFPENDDTTVFQDQCGGVYRIGLFNGSLIWYQPGVPGSLSDGATIMGPDGSVYSCSMPEGSAMIDNNDPHHPGIVRKFRLSDGAVLWTAGTPYPCTNIPTVSADGSTLVVAPGAIPAVDGPFFYYKEEIRKLPLEEREKVHATLEAMNQNNTLRSFFGMEDMTGALMGLDTKTGEVRWRHEVTPSGKIQSAGDSERNYKGFIERNMVATAEALGGVHDDDFVLPHCGPAHWTPPTMDLDGRVYIGDSMGEIRVYDPKTDKELDFHINDGFVPSGPVSAPGLMVFTSCQSVFAFKAQGA